MGLARKRKTPDSEANQIAELHFLKLNREKMGMRRLKQCLTVLNSLMQHQFGWVFNQPVDPVQLGISDYFSIIKNPMDLGTIKKNVIKGKYASPIQFADDVRLTFSNATLYNPPSNEVHLMAVKLSHVFEMRWRLLEDEWANETFNFNLGRVADKFGKENPKQSSRLAETGPAKKKFNLTVKGAENVKPAEPSKNVSTLVQGTARALCKGEGANKSQSSIQIERQSDNYRLSFKQGSCNKVDEFPSEEPLSPSRALRAAMLKRRFADTIVKAQQRALMDQGNKVDPVKLRLERKQLERKQHEEELRLQAKVRVTQAAARMKVEADQKSEREKEREAARRALHQLKKTVDLDNSKLLKDLERLGCSWTWHNSKRKTDQIGAKSGSLNPLEKLGLFIKDDEMDDGVDNLARDIEEGHIGADNDKCNTRDVISDNLILIKKEATVTQEKLGDRQVLMSDKRSASNDVYEFPLKESLSASKALRVAWVKSRFADTILEAQRTLLNKGKKVDPAKLQLGTEKIKRKEQEEKPRLEAKVRATRVATQIKPKADRKMEIEKEREAARLALQQVKKTVDLDNSELLKDLERLSSFWTWHNRKTDQMGMKSVFVNPLEKLGLFIKDDGMDDEDLEIPARDDIEEGEII